MRVLRATLLLGVSLAYFGHVFHLFDRAFWTAGLGDWIDPYFINYLLEHWRHCLVHLSDPSSPPMYFPARHTLGYSHGLILYAPFYLAFRTLLHPFIAHNATLLAVMVAGVVCLYVLLRTYASLSVLEAIVLCAFFATSENVINETTAIWSQRASVFLIPPIALLAMTSRRRLELAPVAGFLAALMLTQDFVTAALTLLVAAALLAPRLATAMIPFWQRCDAFAKGALAIALLAIAWGLFGGIDTQLFGTRIVSTRADRPMLLAVVLITFAAYRAGLDAWTKRFGAGAAAGGLLFLWIYLPAYRAYHSFAGGTGHGIYPTERPFVLVAAVALGVWKTRFGVDRVHRLAALWFGLVSLVIFFLPRVHLPPIGFIRDPIRIIYPFELAVVLALAWLMTSAGRELRIALTILAIVLMALQWNRQTFAFERPVALYQRWVEAPISVDGRCRSFFIAGASDAYMARSPHMWSLYNVDAMFIALRTGVPTLNGYSAWGPVGWELQNPQNRMAYEAAVDNWIRRNALTDVCALDVERRTMHGYE